MTILFFDTETTGFPNPSLSSADPLQPHCVQLAAILTEEDGTERAALNLIIKPDGWSISEAASSIHGITDDIASAYGIRETVAAASFYDLMQQADLLVAHNIKFDAQIIVTMFVRAKRDWSVLDARHCTMIQATPIVNLPPTDRMIAAGFNKPKAPKLSECVSHFFGEDLEGAHDALVDVRACARIFFHMRDGVPA